MKLGFIGTGIITAALVTGFCDSGMEDLHIVVSPRNKEKAAALREKYPEVVTVAADNQEVVDQSDWIFAALLPEHAEEVLGGLTFPEEKHFINVVTTLSLKRAEELIGKRKILVDIVPLTFAAKRVGPVVIYPPVPEVVELMSHVGTSVPVDTAQQIAILRAATGVMCSYYMLLNELVDWCQKNGLDEPSARTYITAFTEAMSQNAAAWEGPLEELAREMTPGGLNWQALTHLEEHGGFALWSEILDPILTRVIKE